MEFDLIPQIVIIFSAGIIIFILGKNIPKIKEAQDSDLLFENKNREEKKKFSYLYGRLTRRIKKDNYQEEIGLVWKWLEKSLRKMRIKFLKLDNKIVSILEKLKKKHAEHENDRELRTKKETDNADGYKKFNDKNDTVSDIGLEENKRTDFENGGLENIAEKNGFTDKPKDELKTGEITSEEKTEDSKEKSNGKNETEKEKKKSDKEKEYIKLILESPKNIKAYWKLGIIYSRRKKYKDSISCFRQIVKIDPSYTKAKKKISDLMGKIKKDKKADEEK